MHIIVSVSLSTIAPLTVVHQQLICLDGGVDPMQLVSRTVALVRIEDELVRETPHLLVTSTLCRRCTGHVVAVHAPHFIFVLLLISVLCCTEDTGAVVVILIISLHGSCETLDLVQVIRTIELLTVQLLAAMVDRALPRHQRVRLLETFLTYFDIIVFRCPFATCQFFKGCKHATLLRGLRYLEAAC